MITVPEIEDDFDYKIEARCIIFTRNANPIGYLNIQEGDSWERILKQLVTKSSKRLTV